MPLDDSSYFNDPILTRLRQARAYLGRGEEYWLRDQLECGDAVCAMGALSKVERSLCGWTEAVNYVEDRLLPDYSRSFGVKSPLAQFNDHPDTTYHDVLDLFSRAIAKREAELLAARVEAV